MKRAPWIVLVVAFVAFVAAACIPTPPPAQRPPPLTIAPLPKVTPWVTTFEVICVDSMGGIHYRFKAPVDGGYGWEGFLASLGFWVNGPAPYPGKAGQYSYVTTRLPFRVKLYKDNAVTVISPTVPPTTGPTPPPPC